MSFPGIPYADNGDVWQPPQPSQPPAQQPTYGGMFGLGPLDWKQKAGLILSSLSDAFNSARRMPSENFQNALGMLQTQRQFAARAGLAQALASGDPVQVRNAKAMALAMGMDISSFQPKFEKLGPGGTLVSIEPLSGAVTKSASAPMPISRDEHYVLDQNGEPVIGADGAPMTAPNVGGRLDPNAQGTIAHEKAVAVGRLGYKPTAPKGMPGVVPTIKMPWQIFGGK